MLEFYYDCLKIYLYMNNFQLIQINTNSFYYAIIEKVYYQF